MTQPAPQGDTYTRATGRWWELDTDPVVAQAVGMIAAQLDVPTMQAELVLRAQSAAHGQNPVDTAADLVRHRWGFAD